MDTMPLPTHTHTHRVWSQGVRYWEVPLYTELGCHDIPYLDCSLVAGEQLCWLSRTPGPPDANHVVVGATGQFAAIRRPLEATHLHLVVSRCRNHWVSATNIIVLNQTIYIPAAK